MTLVELKKLIDDQLNISDENVLSRSKTLISLYNKITNMYISRIKVLKKLKKELEEIYAEVYFRIKKEGYKGLDVGKTKSEVEIFLVLDSKYSAKKDELDDEETLVKYLEMSLETINKMGYNIKNYIELKKLSIGVC